MAEGPATMADRHPAPSLTSVQCSLQNLTLPTPTSTLELDMFKRIIASGCSIKSQQRGEPDLTETELSEELQIILCQKPGSFLMRFGKHLNESDLKLFETSDYEVGFRVKELQQNLQKTSRACSKAIKNRRYVHLEQLMSGSDYFSEEEMQRREPLLFEHYIGQFLSDEEKLQMQDDNKSEMKLSSMILKNMEVNQREKLLEEQRDKEQDQLEESDDSSDEEDTDKGDSVTFAPMELSTRPETAAREKLMLRREFLSVMQTSFLEGRDKDFDYSVVDNNDQYDSLEMKGRDNEDSYFDAEEPSWCEEDTHSDINGGCEGDVCPSNARPDGHEMEIAQNTDGLGT
jgi:hypothetical protein